MSNHVHLIVTPREPSELSRFVGFAAQTFAQFRNHSRGASGKLFEERYKCIPIKSEQQMAVTMTYVALNPVRAGVCEEANDYRWSTFALHAGLEAVEPLINRLWTPSDWYLSLGSTPSARAEAFLDWFEHYRRQDEWSEVYPDPRGAVGRRRFERPDRRTAT
jgi:putative transposase